ncbi:polysaccharide biosynthesis/export protein [Cystobacter fuscus DSM 2262]|uniref:Polysaccharide biosynthesis/export protein n=1 Tax=Cystobacter fuscus (strain ATCC 25194 / DSM 2262 / NBRC 100088 / M29) TaxID=1242864 RepID=S9QSH5_CYSF2|nr:exopolysaccharide export protein EpsY [Cystobacter fuscus]EPX64239.1 polysaccharide biosynthesis/export protein [Cystobacter fuscus DSM 2262]
MKTLPSPLSPARCRVARLAALAALLFVSACYHPGRFVWVDDYREPPPSQQDDSYLIRNGDLLDVNVWNQDRISSRPRVRDDGRISLPLINDVDAAGQTPAALARAVEQKLKELVANPVVTVMVQEAQLIRVSVLGEVRNAGQKKLEWGAGLLQAISEAGGFTDYAREDAIYVLRREPGYQNQEPVRIRFTWENLSRNEGNAATFRLKTGDVVVVE